MKTEKTGKLHVLVYGTGAIGMYVGASLIRAGHQVTFLDRPQVVDHVRQSGITLTLKGADYKIRLPCIVATLDEAFAAPPPGVVVFALKSFDTQSALETLKPCVSQVPPVLCLQNGVENEKALAAVLGEERVIAGSVTTAIGKRGVDHVVVEKLRGIGIAGTHALSPVLLKAFNAAGLNARLYPDPDAMKWSKMLTNLLANATSAIVNMTAYEVFSHPGLYRLEVRQLTEALDVMRSLSIPVVDLPGTPVRVLTSAMTGLNPDLSRLLIREALGKGRGAKMPSFHIDLHSGRGQSEVAYLNGAVDRFGAVAGVSTPVNRGLTDILLALVEKRIPLAEFDHRPEQLLAAIKA